MLLGYFCGRICCQELSKIAQSGHTVYNPTCSERKALVSIDIIAQSKVMWFFYINDIIKRLMAWKEQTEDSL